MQTLIRLAMCQFELDIPQHNTNNGLSSKPAGIKHWEYLNETRQQATKGVKTSWLMNNGQSF
jgi:hypothetical protein